MSSKKTPSFLLKVVFLLFFVFIFQPKFVLAQSLNTELFTEQTLIYVGDTVNVNLSVYPPSDTEPIYTVSATAFYDPTILSYEGSHFDGINWFPMKRVPHELEDTAQGMIRKTAGYPKGLKAGTDFITYTFKAISPGDAIVSLEDGLSLDDYNQETKAEPRKVFIRILERKDKKDATPTEQTSPGEGQLTMAPKQVAVDLKLKGNTVFYLQDDYTMSVEQRYLWDDIVSTTYIEVYDKDYKTVWKKDLTHLANKDRNISFTIPAYTLAPGDYIVSVKNIMSDGSVHVLDERYIGALDNGQGKYGQYKKPFFMVFAVITFFAILHHMIMDREVPDEEEELKKELRKIVNKKKKINQ